MAQISDLEKKTGFNFIERNVKVGPNPKKPDEGIGTVYERIVIDEYFKKIKNKYNLKTICETPADGVTGVPGINSLVFAREGGEVILTNPSKLMLDNAKIVWQREKLISKVKFAKSEIDKLPFKSRSFDLVWNYCMFERFKEPVALVAEMKRISKNYVMIMTQNCWNLGTVAHFIYHKLGKLEWDHGLARQMRIKAIKEALSKCNLEPIEQGTIDTPPWLDTWDMPLRGELKNILGKFGKKWEWETKSTDKKEVKNTSSKLVNFCIWVEKNLPEWFAYSQTHHIYILAKKKIKRI